MHSALRLKKAVLPGLIASVRGEPDIHSLVGTLPYEASPLLDQMRLKGTPVKIDKASPHTETTGHGYCIWVAQLLCQRPLISVYRDEGLC